MTDGHLEMTCDVHTHTIFTRHAYSTIEENVRAAAERGIGLLGSTDHYSRMNFPEHEDGFDLRDFQYFINYGDWPRVWHGVRLLHGVEADIVDVEGHLFGYDVPVTRTLGGNPCPDPSSLKERVFEGCDYVIASIHDRSIADGHDISETTECYVRALEDPKVLILGHTGRSGVPYDLGEVLTVAKEKGKLIEINEHTFDNNPDATAVCQRIAERCAEMGVMVSAATDAHISWRVGRLDRTRAMLERIHFPQELIATRDPETFVGVVERAVGRPEGL